MATHAVTAMFNSRAEAERAARRLMGELGLDCALMHAGHPGAAGDAGAGPDRLPARGEAGSLALLEELLIADEDRSILVEGLRRGGVLVSAVVHEGQAAPASDILESAGAVDLDV